MMMINFIIVLCLFQCTSCFHLSNKGVRYHQVQVSEIPTVKSVIVEVENIGCHISKIICGILIALTLHPSESRAQVYTPSIQLTATKDNQGKNIGNNDDSAIFLKGLISGSVTRASKELILHPIDTIKSRIQTIAFNETMSPGLLYKDVFNGLLPALVGGIPAGAIFFGVKDFFKSFLKGFNANNNLNWALNKDEITIISVILANIPYWILRTPSEVLKTKEQIDMTSPSTSSSPTIQRIKSVYAAGGLTNVLQYLYGSYSSNFIYALPADIIKFIAYEKLVLRLFQKESGGKLEGLEAAVAGALAGMVAQISTTPLDVARTRIMAAQKDDMTPSSTSIKAQSPDQKELFRQANPFTEVVNIYEKEGVSGMFVGLGPRIVRAFASGAVQFASYEITQNLLNK